MTSGAYPVLVFQSETEMRIEIEATLAFVGILVLALGTVYG